MKPASVVRIGWDEARFCSPNRMRGSSLSKLKGRMDSVGVERVELSWRERGSLSKPNGACA